MPANQGSATSRVVGALALAANVFFWGLAGPIVKFGLAEASTPVFLYYRFFIVVLLVSPVLLLWKKPWRSIKSLSDVWMLLWSGAFTNPISLLPLFWGTALTTAISATVLTAMVPLFILAASAMFLGEKASKRKLFGVMLAFFGSLLVILDTPPQADAPAPLLGNLLILGSNAAWTIGALIMKKHARTHHPILFGYFGWLLGAVVCGILTYFLEPSAFLHPELVLQLPKAGFAILYMAVFGSVIAFTAYQIAQQVFPATEVGLSQYLLPLIGVPFAAIWLKEKIGLLFIPAVIIMLLGIGIAENRPARHLPAPKKRRKTRG